MHGPALCRFGCCQIGATKHGPSLALSLCPTVPLWKVFLSLFLTWSRLGRLVCPSLLAFLAGSSCQLLSPAPGEASLRGRSEEAAGRNINFKNFLQLKQYMAWLLKKIV
jgi:hypothetical protein